MIFLLVTVILSQMILKEIPNTTPYLVYPFHTIQKTVSLLFLRVRREKGQLMERNLMENPTAILVSDLDLGGMEENDRTVPVDAAFFSEHNVILFL